MSKIKEQLYVLCAQNIKAKEAELRKAIAEAQEAAAEETKSSAGDKFETGREVIQQEIDLNLSRLTELKNQHTMLSEIMPAQGNSLVSPGAVVYTTSGNYYISIGAGKLSVDGATFYAISPASPIGSKMEGQAAGYEFSLNGKNIRIEKVI
jgi:hypothetical protein